MEQREVSDCLLIGIVVVGMLLVMAFTPWEPLVRPEPPRGRGMMED